MKTISLKELLGIADIIDDTNITIYSFNYFIEADGCYSLIVKASVRTSRGSVGFVITFKNAVNITVLGLTGSMILDGFAIIDHADDGWTKENRYEITDFEDGRLKLFCEQILISMQE